MSSVNDYPFLDDNGKVLTERLTKHPENKERQNDNGKHQITKRYQHMKLKKEEYKTR